MEPTNRDPYNEAVARQVRIDNNLMILRDKIDEAERLPGGSRSNLLDMLGKDGRDNPRLPNEPPPQMNASGDVADKTALKMAESLLAQQSFSLGEGTSDLLGLKGLLQTPGTMLVIGSMPAAMMMGGQMKRKKKRG